MATICLIALILLIWFRTDAWLEYCRVFHLNCLSFYKDYETKKHEDATLTYLQYLRQEHNCFAVRLITCPICLAVWLSIPAAVFTSILMFPIFTMGALLLFTVVDRLLG
jgi:hypothetical protein